MNYMNSIVSLLGYEKTIQTLHTTNKFNNYNIEKDDNLIQPYIMKRGKKISFGLADIQRADKEHIPTDAIMF